MKPTAFKEAHANSLKEYVSFWIPFIAICVYSLSSHPHMWPGSDVWVHLMLIEHNNGRIWHDFWVYIYKVFNIDNTLQLINIIHSAQTLASFILLYLSTRIILNLIYHETNVEKYQINLASWLSTAIWAMMHGFHSGPVWASWFVIFANNYQIALPVYFFGVACIIKSLHLIQTHQQTSQKALYMALLIASVCFVAVIHAAEIPYFIFSGLFLIVVFFNKKYIVHYITLAATAMVTLYFLLQYYSYRLPTLFEVVLENGFIGSISATQQIGAETLSGPYGYNTFNYWFYATILCALIMFAVTLRQNKNSFAHKVLAFIMLSSIPAILYSFNFGAGLLGLITYPELAYRFTWSTFLFMGIPILAVYTCQAFPLKKVHVLLVSLSIFIVIPLLSYKFEADKVSYHYAVSMIKSLDDTKTLSGLSAEQQAWLDDTHKRLLENPVNELVCTDIFTAHYLYFQKNYREVIIPRRYLISAEMRHDRRVYDRCTFPKSGGSVIRNLNPNPSPWNYNSW